jgi:uncharacterized membrane protein required for colicin V production
MEFMKYLCLALVACLLLWRIKVGFRKGMVAEIVSLVSMIVAAVSLVVTLLIIRSYFEHQQDNFLLMTLILVVIGFVYKIASLFFTSFKLIAKLPVIRGFDRILGAILGIAETAVMVVALILAFNFFGVEIPGMVLPNIVLPEITPPEIEITPPEITLPEIRLN